MIVGTVISLIISIIVFLVTATMRGVIFVANAEILRLKATGAVVKVAKTSVNRIDKVRQRKSNGRLTGVYNNLLILRIRMLKALKLAARAVIVVVKLLLTPLRLLIIILSMMFSVALICIVIGAATYNYLVNTQGGLKTTYGQQVASQQTSSKSSSSSSASSSDGVGKNIKNMTYPKKGGIVTIPWICQGDYTSVKMFKAFGCDKDYYGTHHGVYGPNTICTSGCGFTSVAMVATYYAGKVFTPKDVLAKCGKWYHGNGMESQNALNPGTQGWVKELGLTDKCKIVQCTGDKNKAIKLGKKNPLICSVHNCRFTDGAHYIVVRGIDDDGEGCWVNDPNGRSRACAGTGGIAINNGKAMTAEQWLNHHWNFSKDVWAHINTGCWAIVAK